MSLEQSILIISTFITASFMIIIGIVSSLYASRRHNKLVYFFALNWFLQAVLWYLVCAAHYYYSTFLMKISFIPQCIGILLMFIFLDLIEKERVNTLKISLLIFIETMYVTFAFLPGSMEVIPKYGIHIIGICRIFQVIFLIYYVSFYFAWSFKTWKRAPLELKKIANILLIGSILFSIISGLFYIFGSYYNIFNGIAFISHGLGAFITVIVILKEPKIIYILPFKAYRLMIFETTSGIALYSYNWAKIEGLDENFFAMVFQAIGSILNEVLNQGTVREIYMDQAILIVQYNRRYPIASVLVSTKASKSLRIGLKLFHEEFISKFSQNFNNFNEISKFKDSIKLVETIFEFVPKYK